MDEGQVNTSQKFYKISCKVGKNALFIRDETLREQITLFGVTEDEWTSFATFLRSEVSTSGITTVELTDLKTIGK